MKQKGFILISMLFMMVLLAVTAITLNRRAALHSRMALNQINSIQSYLGRITVFEHAVWNLTKDPLWRTVKVKAYTDLIFATGVGNDTITTLDGDFNADGFAKNDLIAIVYSSPDNDGIYTILNDVSLSPTVLEVAPGSLSAGGTNNTGIATIANKSNTLKTYIDLTFATGTGTANDTITTVAGNFNSDGFAKNDLIAIVYSSPDNDGIYTILNDISQTPTVIEVDNGLLASGGGGSGSATITKISLDEKSYTFNGNNYTYTALNSWQSDYRDAITITRTEPDAGKPFNTSFRYYINAFAGTGTGGYSGDDGQATLSELRKPADVAIDSSGNIYIADKDNHRIRKVDTSGIITTVAGTGTSGFSGDGGPATSAKLDSPQGIYVDTSGNIYVADTTNCRIRKFTVGGNINTIAGKSGPCGFDSNGGPATSSKLNKPKGVFADSAGDVYIADTNNHTIRRVDASDQNIYNFAGTPETSDYSGDGGPATSAKLEKPEAVFGDNSGNIFIADTSNHCIRKVNTSGNISTVAGIGTSSDYSGDGGAATSAKLKKPNAVFVDSAGNIFIADQDNHAIRVVSVHDNKIYTLAGTGITGYNGDDQPAVEAQLDNPSGITMAAIRGGRKIYISDRDNNRIRTLGFRIVKKLY